MNNFFISLKSFIVHGFIAILALASLGFRMIEPIVNMVTLAITAIREAPLMATYLVRFIRGELDRYIRILSGEDEIGEVLLDVPLLFQASIVLTLATTVTWSVALLTLDGINNVFPTLPIFVAISATILFLTILNQVEKVLKRKRLDPPLSLTVEMMSMVHRYANWRCNVLMPSAGGNNTELQEVATLKIA